MKEPGLDGRHRDKNPPKAGEIRLLFGFEPELDQAADGFRSVGRVGLEVRPAIDLGPKCW
jgi:hypothetical protein